MLSLIASARDSRAFATSVRSAIMLTTADRICASRSLLFNFELGPRMRS